MNIIKFRGKKRKDGKFIYGSYVHITPMSSFPSIIDNEGFYEEVDPDSVAQFVGYDADGKEVYEGDKLVDSNGNEFFAELWAMGANTLDADVLENGIFKFKLKI